MTNEKLIEILYYVLKLLQNIDVIDPYCKRYKKEYQKRINKAYDELFELIKILEDKK